MRSDNKNKNGADKSSESWRISRRVVNKTLLSSVVGAATPRVLGNLPEGTSSTPYMPLISAPVGLVHERAWQIGDKDISTHILGNSRATIHELGPNIAFFRAPWFSTPNLLTMSLVGPENIRSVSSREGGTGIWHHKLFIGSDAIGEIVDFLPQDESCLRRVISCSVALEFTVHGPRWADYSERYAQSGSILGQWHPGARIFPDYIHVDSLAADPITVQLVFPSSARSQVGTQAVQAVQRTWYDPPRPYYETRLQFAPGRNDLLIAAGVDIPECLEVVERVLAVPAQQSLESTRQIWRSRTARIKTAAQARGGEDFPVEEVIEDVAVLLQGYRSQAGTFAAGPVFPLCYVRDQYGVSRALLALKMFEEAKALLAYYHSVWGIHGHINNAQSDGPRRWFFPSGNDEVEITGYLIIQAFDYLHASGDDDFIAQIFPMLEWALIAQESQLLGNMLPFNGDETYVAGGLLPAAYLNDGSSEATLLYLASAERLITWAAARKRWSAERLAKRWQTLNAAKLAYAGNFVIGGKLTVNNPKRRDLAPLPRFRHGACMGRYDDNCLFLSMTEMAQDGRYFCYSCYPQRTRAPYEPKNYFIPSVALTSSLIDYQAVSAQVMAATLTEAVGVFSKDGRFAWPESKLPGYETGIVALALVQHRHPRSREFVHHMLELRDGTGVWNEYYHRTTPQGCPSRPWESSLSLLALLKYVSA